MKGAFRALELNNLTIGHRPLGLRELWYIEQTPCDIFFSREGILTRLAEKNNPLTNQNIREWGDSSISRVFIKMEDYPKIIERQKENLRNHTRSISIGEPVEIGRKQAILLTICLKYFYEDTNNDELLTLLYQSVKSYSTFLINNIGVHHQIYNDYSKLKFHYIYSQPLLSSLFLIGILKHARIYTEKEMETAFITSYFKDVGMSAISVEKYDLRVLSPTDKKMLHEHALNSVSILANRIPLNNSQIKIIEGHHIFSTLTRELENFELNVDDGLNVYGAETLFISITDIIAAMINDRPYRNATSLFQSLDLIKELLIVQFPQEFKLIVSYFKTYFTKGQS